MKDGITISNAEPQDADEQLDLFSNQPLPVSTPVVAGQAAGAVAVSEAP